MALTMLSPLLLSIALILKITGEGKIFYRQERVGRDGQEFKLLKFATMLEASPHLDGGHLTFENDPRVLPFGKVLRATKINEIPQLWNVLCGEMSIIGPRPQTRQHFDLYTNDIKFQLLKVRPGLSGLASIVFRDEQRILKELDGNPDDAYASTIAPFKGELEAWHVDRLCVHEYLLLIFLTVITVLRPESKLYRVLLTDLPEPQDSQLKELLAY